jgi:hypothetical protein
VPAIRVLAMTGGMMADTNADGEFTPLDALLILNRLRDRAAGLNLASEGESGLGDPGYAAAVDLAFADLPDDDEDDDNRDGVDVWRILAADLERFRAD